MTTHRSRLAGVGLLAVALAGPAASQYTTASLSTGGDIPDADVGDQQMSGDGRYVVFSTPAGNLVAGDTLGYYDVYLRDTVLATCERVSLGLGGAEPTGHSRWPAVSDDGRYVAFGSEAANLVAGDTNLAPDVFLVDRTLGTTTRISVTYLGGEPATGYWGDDMLDVSDDSRYVVFVSTSDDLVGTFTGGATRDVFVRDVVAGTTTLVSIAAGGTQSDGGWYPSIDDGGDLVSFTSNSWLIHPSDSDTNDDVFVWHRATGGIELVSAIPGGTSGSSPGNSEQGRITPDGRYVVFESMCTDLDPTDTFVDRDVFLRDRTLGTTEVVSLDRNGAAGPYSDCFTPDVSADGRYVVFHSNSELTGVVHSPFWLMHVYLRDRTAGTTEYVSVPRGWYSSVPVGGTGAHVSDDGTEVVFRDDAPPQEDPSGIHYTVVQRARDGETNIMSLVGYNGVGAGTPITLTGYDAPPDSLFIVAYSFNVEGTTFSGHDFDLGLPLTLQGFGLSDSLGGVSYTSLPVPLTAKGLTVYLELAAISGGTLYDSNYIGVEIL